MNRYFYIDPQGEQKGPLNIDELRNNQITKETKVWTQGMPEWQGAYEVEELQHLFEVSASTLNQYGEPTATHKAINPQTSAYNAPAIPKTWMVESILVTILPFLFCGNVFSLIGIAAIVNASKVESLYRSGMFAQSLEASLSAARWTKITFWISIAGIVLGIIAIVLSIVLFGSMAGILSTFT